MTEPSPVSSAPGIDPARLAALVVMGLVIWASAIPLVRWMLAQGLLGNAMTAPVYAAVLAGTAPLVWAVPRLLGLPPRYRLHCAAIMATMAAMLDGMAIRWTTIYAIDAAQRADAAGVLLWGAGVAVLLGLVMARE